MRVAYVIGPYRAGTVRGIVENIRRAEEVALALWRLGFAVICPHKNTALFDGAAPDSVWAAMEPESIHAIVTDPPYGLGFMGKGWDHDIPGEYFWREALRVAKPGAHLLAFGGTRTFHRLMCAIEDAGWEIRDTIMWVYGSGFPKSLDVSKAIDKAAGKERTRERRFTGTMKGGAMHAGKEDGNARTWNDVQTSEPITDAASEWQGWGTALKPAWEPIVVARKPLVGTVAGNVQAHGTGAINVDGCRVEWAGTEDAAAAAAVGYSKSMDAGRVRPPSSLPSTYKKPPYDLGAVSGRWPANLIHDGSEEVLACFPTVTSGKPAGIKAGGRLNCFGDFAGGIPVTGFGDSGSAARFFYTAKASGSDRGNRTEPELPLFGEAEREFRNTHPTVKPLSPMRYLVRLVTPPGGLLLDCFAGSGTTLVAAKAEGFRAVGIEIEEASAEIAAKRLAA